MVKERKSKGIKDIQGQSPKVLTSKDNKGEIGTKTREELAGGEVKGGHLLRVLSSIY